MNNTSLPGDQMPPRKRRFRLHTKIIVWSFVPTALILLLVALTAYYAYAKVTEEFAVHNGLELARLSANEISSAFEDYRDRLWTVARVPGVFQGDAEQQRAVLEKDSQRLIFFDGGVYLLNHLGIVTATLPHTPDIIGQDWSERSYFTRMFRATEPYLTEIVPDGPGGMEVIVLAVPILGEEDELKGIALGMFRLDANVLSPFYGTLLKLRIGRAGTAYIVDHNNRIVFSSDSDQIGGDFSTHPASEQALVGEIGSSRTDTPDGRDVVLGYAPVPRTAWSLVIEEDWGNLVQPIQRYRGYLIALLVVGVVLPSIVVMVGVRHITGPVHRFIAAAKDIAGGDFKQTIELSTGDELEDLADQFNIMAEQLDDSYASLERRVQERTHELTALNTIAGVVSRSLDLDQILPDALAKTIEVMGMDIGAILRLDNESNSLVIVADQGLSESFRSVASRMRLDDSVIKMVADTMLPATRVVSDYPPGPVREELEKMGIQLVISIPLLAKDKVLGAINVGSRWTTHPSPEIMAVAASIGQQIGVAMENARLYAQTVEYAREMETARATAEEANASKSAFLANVSHELRTPLTSILGFARIVQKRLEERVLPFTDLSERKTERAVEQVRDNLTIVLNEGQRLTTLINNVLDLEKIEAGRMEWHMELLHIEDVIKQATSATASLFGEPATTSEPDLPGDLSLSGRSDERHVVLVTEIAKELPVIIGDRDKLVQVVINLISNAVKFTSQGTITLEAEAVGGELVVSIRDTGIGIAAEDLPLIFEKFQQVGDTLTDKPKGTGLGLAISKEIIDRHGGRIWAESTPGEGSTFSFSLPRVSPQAETVPQIPVLDVLLRQLAHHVRSTTPTSVGEQKCILVVDDDPHIRQFLRQELENQGYLVFEAKDGHEALSQTSCTSPDLIILDVKMPGLSGFDVAAVLKNDPLTMGVPIIMLTIVEDKERGLRLGVDRYLTKPVDSQVLLNEVKSLLAQGKSHRRVLVVDEDASTLATISAALQAQGYQVLQAGNGIDGIQKATDSQPDLVLANELISIKHDLVRVLRFEKGLQNLVVLLYQTEQDGT
jgi:signal transduction histidine kinase/DNA-binding response OmpR family regulator